MLTALHLFGLKYNLPSPPNSSVTASWYDDQADEDDKNMGEEGENEGGRICRQTLEAGWASNRWARRRRDLRKE